MHVDKLIFFIHFLLGPVIILLDQDFDSSKERRNQRLAFPDSCYFLTIQLTDILAPDFFCKQNKWDIFDCTHTNNLNLKDEEELVAFITKLQLLLDNIFI